MIRQSLEIFVSAVMEPREITAEDVRRLQRDVLPEGITSRDEADVLIALDRAIMDKAPAWSAFMMAAIVDFVVWQSRPTGIVGREAASWLTTSLACGTGPTNLAIAIAFEVVRECEQADEVLVAFVMRWARGRSGTVVADGRRSVTA